jgi:hypothetical protein
MVRLANPKQPDGARNCEAVSAAARPKPQKKSTNIDEKRESGS